LKAGARLFEAGEPGDALFVVCTGRLQAVAPGGGEVIVREIGSGGAIGELSLLTGSPRSASVRARRDSLLLRVGREDFRQLQAEPEFANALLGALGERLRGSWPRQTEANHVPRVIAIAALGGGPSARELADSLKGRLCEWTRVAVLTGEGMDDGERSSFAAALDAEERQGGQVMLVVDNAISPGAWDRFALEQADRILVASDCAGAPPSASGLRGCDLLIAGSGRGAIAWVEELSPRTTYRLSTSEGLLRLARRLSGRALGVVLSGGGARGLAHIGALSVLQEAGVEIDRIAGCSMGAIVGALFARGLGAGEVSEICRGEFVRRNPLNDYTLPLVALTRRAKAEAMLRRMFGGLRVEDLPLSFLCVSTDMVSGRLLVHRSGPLIDAVGASACLPVLMPPLPSGERLLVDGGVLNNLPAAELAATGEGPVLAVDVTARYEPREAPSRPRGDALRTRLRAALTGEEGRVPRLGETITRMIALGSVDTSEEARTHADLVIEPIVSGIGITAFDQAERIIEAGREAAARSLDRARQL
jgi:predicted acylesterase/phospholipase RssA